MNFNFRFFFEKKHFFQDIATHNELVDFLKDERVMPKPPNCSEDIYKLMKKCWKLKPADRISFVDIFAKLLRMLIIDDQEFLIELKKNSFVIQQLNKQEDDKIQKSVSIKKKGRKGKNSPDESFAVINLNDCDNKLEI